MAQTARSLGSRRRRIRLVFLCLRVTSVLAARRLKRQRMAVDAIAKSGWGRAVFEHVAEVGVACRAENLGAPHPVAVVRLGLDVLLIDGFQKLGQPVPESNLVSESKSGARSRRTCTDPCPCCSSKVP